jgi:hypothetical protein
MKQDRNIHILPTDKPSRLCLSNNNILTIITESNYNFSHIKSVHIYITNDEEIKDGDWIKWGEAIYKANKKYTPPFKKIILTTDDQLIKDSVQAIDDEFLEFIVKNPSCESVEVEKEFIQTPDNLKDGFYYKIIIPKEEPKQENCCTPEGQIKRYVDCKGCDRKPKLDTVGKQFYENADMTITVKKQETLEEAAKRYTKEEIGLGFYPDIEIAFEKGAKWQQEQDKKLYSEEEVLQLLLRLQQTESYDNLYGWFEQFKKK